MVTQADILHQRDYAMFEQLWR